MENLFINKVVLKTGEVLIDLTQDKVTENELLEETICHDASGAIITGKIKKNGDVTKSFDGLEEDTSVEIPAGYTTGGTISLTKAIEEALAAI